MKKEKMLEVVINRCYGGFSISVGALEELYKMKSDVLEKIPIKEYFQKDETQEYMDGHIKMCGLVVKDSQVISLKDRRDKLVRGNKDLITVIKKLGDKANGQCAKLEVIEVPADVEWEIDEYDGMESVEETHRSWS